MSNIVDKAKDTLTGDNHHTLRTTGPTTGPTAGSTTGSTTKPTTGPTMVPTTGPATGSTTGPMGVTGTTGTSEGVAGPHSSRLANTLDPRVDSDMDGSYRVSNRIGTTNDTAATTGATNTTGATGTASGLGPHTVSFFNRVALDKF